MRSHSVRLVAIAWLTLAGARGSSHAAPPERSSKASIAHFATATDALRSILGEGVRVVAFGEYHATNPTATIPSALSRFTRELWPSLSGLFSDLVVETWISAGHCGRQEEKVVDEVQTTTDRPPQTENEIVTLLKAAKAAGVTPHILTLSCKDYAQVAAPTAKTDFARMLTLTRKKLQGEITRCLDGRGAIAAKAVAVYGGALHSDLHPAQGTRAWAFGPAISAKTAGAYLEVDLLVPELMESSSISREPWYELVRTNLAAGDVLLVTRGERSFLLVFSSAKR